MPASFCQEEDFDPLSRATLYRIIEVREASQRKAVEQGVKRLGDETSVSEQKGVMQWTGIELGARPKFKIQRSKFKILIIY